MARPRIGEGIRKFLPLKERTEGRPNPRVTKYNPWTELDPHVPCIWHRARPTGIPHISWAIYRLRRARVGQCSLFNSKRVLCKRKATCTVTFWGWGIPAPTKRKKVA